MKNTLSLKLKSLIIIATCSFAIPSFSVEREENKNQIILEDGMSKRLLKGSNPNPNFQRILYAGAYHEFIFGPAHSQYTASPIGVVVGFENTLNSFMRGGIELRWSHWQAKDILNNPPYLMPVGLYSRIKIQPRIKMGSGSLAPYLAAGLGYMIPFYGNKFFTMDVPRDLGNVMFIGGGGIEVMFIKSFGLNFGFDTWLDLEGKDYFAGDLSAAFVVHF